ncbi:Uncharacterised protein [Mycolicibacterium vanbaalenii]|uniref:Transmembrane protein n=1 Tax=Mycolicibacterium vanbaalenii TaxID=110539 RepID=A0A5S9R7X5_MYCVN|nr:hypothetical protein [Mycolicibacterium vanbaalenii]CAA0134551.1 Uncharacterised protein [Mycolicibacterium vanbaalenii]
MPEPIQKAVRRFWALLDSETVRLFVWPFFIGLLCWGIYGTFFSAPIQFVYPVMGEAWYNIWIWMHIPGPAAVLAGLMMRRGGTPIAQMSTPMLFRDYMGLWLQLGGYVTMFFALLYYEISAIQATHWGASAFSVFALAPYVLGCLFLALQTGRKLWRGETLHRATRKHGWHK